MTPAAVTSAPIFHPNLPLSVIVESAHNPRKRYDQATLEELAETIRATGIHNPVIVREIETPSGTRFELAAGHRRCRAARLAGLVEVPALIRELDDNAFLELLHLDNLQRDGVDPLDEALGYEQLLGRGYDIATIADKIGKSITYVATRVRLLSLGTAAREAMQRGYVKVSHAIELAKLPEGMQEQLLRDQWNLSPEALSRAAGVSTGEPTDTDAPADTDETDAEDPAEDGDEATFAAPAGDTRFRDTMWQAVREPTLQDLKREIALEVYRKLSAVPWDLADDTLIPEAGACARCPKRSSMEPLLFAELDTGEDACLDASCFDAKREMYYDLQRGLASASRGSSGAIDHDADVEAERKERLRAQKQQEREEVARREKAEREREGAQAVRTASVRAVLAAVPQDALTNARVVQQLLLTMVMDLGRHSLQQLLLIMECDTTPPADARPTDWEWMLERITTWARHPRRTDKDLARAVVLASIGRDAVILGTDVDDTPDVLHQWAHLLGVDVDQVAREVERSEKAETKKARRKAKAVSA